MRASLKIGETVIMGSDVLPAAYERPTGFQILLAMEDPGEAERVFAALAENGTIVMPLEQTFWAVRFGVLIDQFGIPWSVNCEQAAETPA